MRLTNYYLGGDVSKGYCDFVILDDAKKIVEPNFQLDDTPSGHQGLNFVLKEFREKHPYAPIYAAVESTGGYENNWYHLLWEMREPLDLNVARLNPLGVKRHRDAKLQRVVTDKISARNIAEYLIAYHERVIYNQKDYFSPLKRQWKFVRMIKKQHAQLMSLLESLMYVAHPQMIKYCSEDVYDWTLAVLKQYPTAENLAHATVKTLSTIPYVTEDRARELIKEAKTSVASALEPGMASLIQATVEQIINLRKSISSQVNEMIDSYSHLFPEIEILTSFKGIAEYSAFGLLLEIGSIDRFPSVKKLASFFGVHPAYKQSGDGTPIVKMSNKGRKEPRWILFNVAKSAVVCNEMIKDLYNEYLERGISKMSAIGIMMHKILRIIYGMLKHNTKYDPEIDKAYRNRMKKRNKNDSQPYRSKPDKNRRYQAYDRNAPISKRQTKKRKQMKEKDQTQKKDENPHQSIGGKGNE